MIIVKFVEIKYCESYNLSHYLKKVMSCYDAKKSSSFFLKLSFDVAANTSGATARLACGGGLHERSPMNKKTGRNIIYSYKLLKRHDFDPRKIFFEKKAWVIFDYNTSLFDVKNLPCLFYKKALYFRFLLISMVDGIFRSIVLPEISLNTFKANLNKSILQITGMIKIKI
ncbi:hypothetical protein BpHYR1_039485 [Brachionus plicatilis]|uniref:Uncharacterized protein n=1 Tax=Brachionus plicatilis TaxID=10195 RepID=A0A3M7PD71_BRAPC|nr:hypothetical protein BpHYR1_039485 [Brachionus plicatilis]